MRTRKHLTARLGIVKDECDEAMYCIEFGGRPTSFGPTALQCYSRRPTKSSPSSSAVSRVPGPTSRGLSIRNSQFAIRNRGARVACTNGRDKREQHHHNENEAPSSHQLLLRVQGGDARVHAFAHVRGGFRLCIRAVRARVIALPRGGMLAAPAGRCGTWGRATRRVEGINRRGRQRRSVEFETRGDSR